MRHYSYTQNSNDVAVFDQSLWRFLHGRGFYNSIEGINHFGVHNSPILFLLLPVYALFLHPVTLIFCQVVAGALGVILVFLIAREIFDDQTGFFFALLFALYHPLHGVSWDLLNELCYVVVPLLLAFYGLISKRWGLMWLGLMLAMLCKEEIGFTVGFFGIYVCGLGIKNKNRNLVFQGFSLAFIGVGWSFFSLDILIPHFRSAPYQYLSSENRYSEFGNSMGAILAHLASHPFQALRVAFILPKILYCVELLAPLAFFSLFAPAILLIAIPTLAANLLSNASMMSMTGARYPAAIIPFIFIAAIYGTKKIVDRSNTPKQTLRKILVTQLVFTILCTLLFSSTPLRIPFKVPRITAHCAAVREILRQIPPGSIVSAQANFTAHIAHGCIISPFFRNDAQFVLLDPTFPQWYRDSNMTVHGMLDSGYLIKVSRDHVYLFTR